MISPQTLTQNLTYSSHKSSKYATVRVVYCATPPTSLLKEEVSSICFMWHNYTLLLFSYSGECASHKSSMRAFWSGWIVFDEFSGWETCTVHLHFVSCAAHVSWHPPTSAIPPFLIKGNVPTCMRNMKIAKLWTIPLRRTVWWSPLWLHLQGTSKLVQAIHHFICPSYGSMNASIIALSSKGPFIGVMNGARRLSAQSLCHLSQWMCLIREVPVQFQDILCTGHPFCALR